jgi:hypothetical protein
VSGRARPGRSRTAPSTASTSANSSSIYCTLLHYEDDTAAAGYYFATDGGNGYRSIWGNNFPSEPDISTFILKQSGDTNCPIEPWKGFAILCF